MVRCRFFAAASPRAVSVYARPESAALMPFRGYSAQRPALIHMADCQRVQSASGLGVDHALLVGPGEGVRLM